VREFVDKWYILLLAAVVISGALYTWKMNDDRADADRAQTTATERLNDCTRRVIASLDKRSQYSNDIGQYNTETIRTLGADIANLRATVAAILQSSTRESSRVELQRLDAEIAKNEAKRAQLDAQQQAAERERKKYPLPELKDCEK